MFEEFKKATDYLNGQDPAVQEAMSGWIWAYTVASVAYYAAAAAVAIFIGRRLVQALFAAWREVRREKEEGAEPVEA